MRTAGAAPFKKMMKANTGMEGNIVFPPTALALASEMDKGNIHLGVFQGHEFAWAKSKYPDLVAIAVSVPMQPVQAFCVVKWDSTAVSLADLKGQTISLPPVHRDYCEMYLAKELDKNLKEGFATKITPGLATDALQDVIDGRAAVTVVNSATLKFFESVYPGQYKNLKILCQSEVFPNACVAVKKNTLHPKTVAKFTKALLDAQTDAIGRPMLTTWKLKGFATVPADYDFQIAEIEKIYPAPGATKVAVDK